jgi:hypothetical protein
MNKLVRIRFDLNVPNWQLFADQPTHSTSRPKVDDTAAVEVKMASTTRLFHHPLRLTRSSTSSTRTSYLPVSGQVS